MVYLNIKVAKEKYIIFWHVPEVHLKSHPINFTGICFIANIFILFIQ